MLDPATSAAQFANGKFQGRRSKDTLSTQFYACRLFRLGSPVLRLILASKLSVSAFDLLQCLGFRYREVFQEGRRLLLRCNSCGLPRVS